MADAMWSRLKRKRRRSAVFVVIAKDASADHLLGVAAACLALPIMLSRAALNGLS